MAAPLPLRVLHALSGRSPRRARPAARLLGPAAAAVKGALKNLRPDQQKGLAFARKARFHGAALGLRASLMFRRRHEERTMTGLAAESAEGGFQRGKIFVAIELSKARWTSGLNDLQTRDGRRFPEQLMSEIKREAKLLETVKKLLREVDLELIALVRTQRSRRRSPAREAAHPIASKLVRIRGIGPTLAAVLATELFYRRFDNRRQVASYIGLAPTPYSSGATSRDQGISKAGNNRARHNAIEACSAEA